MPVHELSSADIIALSIVGKGANRKQFFLRKAALDETLVALPGPERLVKADDWSTVYAVVAEPGWLEEAGVGGDQTIMDRWASEEEIRKAAHRFMANGALVNRMHETLEPYGDLVENAVALTDFKVDGQTIKKGSWYVAITPNAEGKEAIEKGEFTGVSIQGTAVRTLVDKAIDFAAAAGPLRHLIAHYRKYPKPFTQCVADNTKRFGPRAKNICAGLKDIMRGTTKWRAQFQKTSAISKADEDALVDQLSEKWGKRGLTADDAKHALKVLRAHSKGSSAGNRSLGGVEKGFLRKLAEKAGISSEDLDAIEAEEVAKTAPTFAARMAERDLDEELPQAMDVLRSSVWAAFYPPPDGTDRDPKALVGQSLDEFKEWALDLIERVPSASIAKQIEDAGESTEKVPSLGSMDGDEELKGRMEALEKQVKELPAEIAKAIKEDGEDKPPTAEELDEAVSKLTESVEKVAADVKKLGEGGSSQGDDDDEADVAKTGDKPYAGIL